MHIEFHGSPRPTLGVEVELELVDRTTGDLVSRAGEILSELGAPHPDGDHPKAKHELFDCTIEIITGICDTVAEARADLGATLAEVRAAADRRDIDVICSGTHPFAAWADQVVSDDPRYHRLVDEMGLPAQRLQIFGVHFHVGVRHGERSVGIANGLSEYIPHFLALSASSPYWEGHDTGLASARSKIFESLPTAGLPEQIHDWAEFERFMHTLISAEAISSIREVWWDIRPHPDFGTVELRMCDGLPTLREVTALAALAQCLVTWLDNRGEAGEPLPPPSEWVLRQNKWRAARYGLDAQLIVDTDGNTRPLVDSITELVDTVAPFADELGCTAELDGVREILAVGPSYIRQRRLVETGADLRAVVAHLVDELAQDRPLTPRAGVTALDGFLADHGEELVAFRRRLHARPELSWQENETTAAVRDRLQVAGVDARSLPGVHTGLVVDLGAGEGPTVLLRADLDALPLDDEKDVPYRSTMPGACHACGHDVHTTILLGAGLALHRMLGEQGAGRVRLLFQPAEEALPGGAKALYDTPVLDDVAVAYALHCDPGLDVGLVGLRVGSITSAADRVTIHVEGAGGHTARPHLTTDLVHVLGSLITEVPAGLDKLTDSRDAVTLVFGQVAAGLAANVIPTQGELHGTLRVRGRSSWEAAPAIVGRLVEATAAAYGAKYHLDYQRGSPPVENDEQAVAVMRQAATTALGPDTVVPTEQSVGNEDFSWLLERAPGAYARLGVRPVGSHGAADLHAGAFDVDEGAIAVGVRLLVQTALEAIRAYGRA